MSWRALTGKKSFWEKIVLLVYPYLLAYYPIFALRNYNIDYVDLASILRALILVTCGTLLIQAITLLSLRSLEKSSIIVSLIVISFLSYGHIYNLLEKVFSPDRGPDLSNSKEVVRSIKVKKLKVISTLGVA